MSDRAKSPHIAVLVYETKVEGGYAPPRYSEDIVLIHASSVEEARTTAEAMGRAEATSYQNVYDETVTWSFVGVADVRAALYDTLGEDTALYSRGFEDLRRYRETFALTSLSDPAADPGAAH
ncbi:DUF4288 domain-containing protein [Spongiactinospora rosea]|uniref:DUF4288 domain-containing protein n=1 Tax=Spongiactinospora rosea TaxID=2248750 RepID=UPI0013141597|nr:DUF4288 domain-containing protein [Spongiactinospora rosea]